jgi:tRNA-splicing ligase RtcB
MGAATYIVTGLGNPASYHSASHGAGRRISRSQAKREFSVDSLRQAMIGQAWLESKAQGLFDEHSLSYKNIGQVMEDQRDLCHVEHVLHQVLNYKGA